MPIIYTPVYQCKNCNEKFESSKGVSMGRAAVEKVVRNLNGTAAKPVDQFVLHHCEGGSLWCNAQRIGIGELVGFIKEDRS